jgi:hypothetical protein
MILKREKRGSYKDVKKRKWMKRSLKRKRSELRKLFKYKDYDSFI